MFWFQKPPQEKDDRFKGTVVIWIFATILFTLSVPVAMLMHSVLLPLVVLFGAAFATALTWILGNRTKTARQQHVEDLEERIANLEMLMCFSRRDEDDTVSNLQDDLCDDLNLPPVSQRVRSKVTRTREKVTY
jgi:ABC-type transport system involved in cytochrome bd biosynthesis fused ATPase/permease subunit